MWFMYNKQNLCHSLQHLHCEQASSMIKLPVLSFGIYFEILIKNVLKLKLKTIVVD